MSLGAAQRGQSSTPYVFHPSMGPLELHRRYTGYAIGRERGLNGCYQICHTESMDATSYDGQSPRKRLGSQRQLGFLLGKDHNLEVFKTPLGIRDGLQSLEMLSLCY